jgi:hypothetical protein
MRQHRWRLAAASIAAVFVLLSSKTFAEGEIPSGVFVKGSDGVTWWVLGDRKLQVPFYPATDEQIAALTSSAQWIIPNESGRGIAAGARPEWATTGVSTTAPAPLVEASAQPVPPAPPSASAVAPAPARENRIGETSVLTSPSGLRVLVTVNAVEDNARPAQYQSAAKGRYLLVDWTIKKNGSEDFQVSRLDFKLQTSDGFVVDQTFTTVREPDLDTATLGPGQLARGWLTYDVPAGKPVVSAIYQPGRARQFVIADLS